MNENITQIENTVDTYIAPAGIHIDSVDDMLDLIAVAQFQNACDALIIKREQLNPDFFDLKTGLAGEILQKCSTYRLKLTIIGDFSDAEKSLRDFIRESNKRGQITFKMI